MYIYIYYSMYLFIKYQLSYIIIYFPCTKKTMAFPYRDALRHGTTRSPVAGLKLPNSARYAEYHTSKFYILSIDIFRGYPK